MIGEIIAVGEEVLSGDVINTNAASISTKLADIGIFCRYHEVVGDVFKDIKKQFKKALKRSDIIIFSGGLGPTKDDLTKEAVAQYLGKKLYMDEALKAEMLVWFANRNYKLTENNLKQALTFQGAKALKNNNGTAPGFYIKVKESHVFLLPGPPNELIPMMEESVIPMIDPLVKETIVSRTFKLVNIGESAAVTVLDDIMESSRDFTLAPYAKMREVQLKATAIGEDINELYRKINGVEKIIYDRLGEYVYTNENKELIDVIFELLYSSKKTLSIAESCTGGLIAESFVDKAGASAVFSEGFVTYSNESKIKRLNVQKETLDTFGAVSENVALEMAKGLIHNCDTDFGISVTGIAGPDGGTEEKPVGLVYIGIGTKTDTYVYEHRFGGSRSKIRQQSAKCAWIHLWEILKEQ